MYRTTPAAAVLVSFCLATLVACSSSASLSPAPAGSGQQGQAGRTVRPQSISAYPICQPTQSKSETQCGGLISELFAPNPNKLLPTQVPGYHPSDLQSAYGVTAAAQTKGGGQTVALVTAYLDPLVLADLTVYRATFGLPLCTVLNGCLKIVTPLLQPPANTAWGIETALDAEVVSAVCPNCNIMIVEAKDDQVSSLAGAVGTAVAQGATVISNSYAAPETSQNAGYESSYAQHGVAVVAGAGDGGYSTTAIFPASSPHVTAVGGTTLTKIGNTWTQTVWAGTGSGCSAYFAKPSWQPAGGCTMRTDNDVAAVADPDTGVGIWSLYAGGWVVVGGTSVAAPLVASLYALAGNTAGMHDAPGLYADPGAFAAITGSNGSCQFSYLCNAGPGYNGPAGLGVPTGLSAF